MFKDVGDDYSPERIEFELRKAKMVQNIKYYGYDTLKGYNTDDWSQIKQFATFFTFQYSSDVSFILFI